MQKGRRKKMKLLFVLESKFYLNSNFVNIQIYVEIQNQRDMESGWQRQSPQQELTYYLGDLSGEHVDRKRYDFQDVVLLNLPADCSVHYVQGFVPVVLRCIVGLFIMNAVQIPIFRDMMYRLLCITFILYKNTKI
jgi:hypothetical protein